MSESAASKASADNEKKLKKKLKTFKEAYKEEKKNAE